MNNFYITKKEQRAEAKKNRKIIFLNNKDAHNKLFRKIEKKNFYLNSKIIASFISIKDEIETKSINDSILSSNKILCLPVIDPENDNLIFREYNKNTSFIKNKFDISEPSESSARLIPDLIFTPCLAFDLKGHRIGYGGGFYDKVFSSFKKQNHNFYSLILAFDQQKIDSVISEPKDQRVDFILTEKKLYKINN